MLKDLKSTPQAPVSTKARSGRGWVPCSLAPKTIMFLRTFSTLTSSSHFVNYRYTTKALGVLVIDIANPRCFPSIFEYRQIEWGGCFNQNLLSQVQAMYAFVCFFSFIRSRGRKHCNSATDSLDRFLGEKLWTWIRGYVYSAW